MQLDLWSDMYGTPNVQFTTRQRGMVELGDEIGSKVEEDFLHRTEKKPVANWWRI